MQAVVVVAGEHRAARLHQAALAVAALVHGMTQLLLRAQLIQAVAAEDHVLVPLLLQVVLGDRE
jgi:hypothetical protein